MWPEDGAEQIVVVVTLVTVADRLIDGILQRAAAELTGRTSALATSAYAGR